MNKLTIPEIEQVLDLVDNACKRIPLRPRKRGPQPEFSDILIISLLVLKSLSGFTSERSFMRWLAKLPIERLANIPERSRFNRRARALKDEVNLVQKALAQRLNRQAKQDKEVRLVDSKGVPVISYARAKRCKSFKKGKEVNFGKCASTKQKFYGVKIHLTTNVQGIPTNWCLKPANRHDVRVLPELTQKMKHKTVVGDKGYISQDLKKELKKKQQIRLITPYKKNMKQKNTQKEKRLLRFRKLIDTVFSQLKEHMLIERTLAKSYLGLETRIAGMMLAMTVGIAYNQTYHRPLLALKSIII